MLRNKCELEKEVYGLMNECFLCQCNNKKRGGSAKRSESEFTMAALLAASFLAGVATSTLVQD